MFCKNCGSLLKPIIVDDKKIMGCSCGFTSESTSTLKLAHKDSSKDVEVVHKEEPSSRLIIDEECPKCHHDKVFYWTQQTGPSDEPEDQIYKCVKCGYSWRENY